MIVIIFVKMQISAKKCRFFCCFPAYHFTDTLHLNAARFFVVFEVFMHNNSIINLQLTFF